MSCILLIDEIALYLLPTAAHDTNVISNVTKNIIKKIIITELYSEELIPCSLNFLITMQVL